MSVDATSQETCSALSSIDWPGCATSSGFLRVTTGRSHAATCLSRCLGAIVNPQSVSAIRAVRGFLVLSATIASTLAMAQEAATPEQVVVTATRTETPLSSVGDSVTVITGEQAKASQKIAVSDLLSTTPGVSANRNGGLGMTTSVRIRGAESDQTLVLMDGLKLNDPSTPGGGFNFGDLLLDDVERIEVLRGSQSVLWGSQAIGGVVNIVTAEPSGPFSSAISTEAGTQETGKVTARLQSGNDHYGWRVGGLYLTTDGVSAFDEDLGGTEDDGYRSVGANARGFFNITDDVTAELRSNWWRGRNEFDGFPPPSFAFSDTDEYGTTEEWVTYAGLKANSFSNRLQHRIGVALTDTTRENFDPASSVELTLAADGRNLRYEYQGTLSLNDQINAVFGIEREGSDFTTSSPSEFDPDPIPLDAEVTLDSIYAHLQFAPISALTLSGGARYDDHETFGDDTSSQMAAAWSVSRSTLLRASYGEGFKAPTLYQLYSEYGTVGLQPEKSDDWDVGVEQRLINGRVMLSATYFARDTENMIDFVSCFGVVTPRCALQPFGYYENIQQTTADGIELALTAQLAKDLLLTANFTDLDARNDARNSANYGNELPRRAAETAAAELTYEWSIPLTTTLAAQYVGRSYDDVANQVELDSYTLLGLRANYRLSARAELYGRIENALDEHYATTRRYGSVGRAAYVGLRMTW
jgi:vitamin B12 transporter